MSSGFHLFKNAIDISQPEVDQWALVSVRSLVPSNATGVILRLSNRWYKTAIAVRKPGSTDDFKQYCLLSWNAHVYAFCGLSPSLEFELFKQAVSYPAKVFLCGYTDEAVEFLTNIIDLGSFVGGGTKDISRYTPADATGAILVIYNTDSTGRQYSIRSYGATEWHHNSSLYGHHASHLGCGGEASSFCYAVVSLAEGKKVEAMDRSYTGKVHFALVGFTKPPVQIMVNSVLKTIPTSGSWQSITAPELPDSAVAAIIEIRNTAPGKKNLTIRQKGSSDSDTGYSSLGLETAMWGICGVEHKTFEVFADWAARAMFFLHGWTMAEGAPPEFPCPYCGQVFYSQEDLNAHILSDHTFECPYCDEVFHTQEELNAHILLAHHFVCPYCPQVFPTQGNLDAHILASHHFVCPYCAQIFPTQTALDEHIAQQHPITPQKTLTITAGSLIGTITEANGQFSMDISSGHLEGTIE